MRPWLTREREEVRWNGPRLGAVPEHPQWNLEDGELVREVEFDDFEGAFTCVKHVGEEVQDFGRHPDIGVVGGKRARFVIAHSHRRGITRQETRMMDKVDASLQRHSQARAGDDATRTA